MALQSNDIEDGESAEFDIIIHEAVLPKQEGILYFWAKCDSEVDFDFMEVLLDGDSVESGAVIVNDNVWAEYSVNLDYNDYVRFSYEKDGSVTEGEDTCWVDGFRFVYCCYPEENCGGIEEVIEEYIDTENCNCYNIASAGTFYSIMESVTDDWCRTSCFAETGIIQPACDPATE